MDGAIYSIRLKFDVTPQGGSSDLIVNLNRHGNSELKYGPRPRHQRRIANRIDGLPVWNVDAEFLLDLPHDVVSLDAVIKLPFHQGAKRATGDAREWD